MPDAALLYNGLHAVGLPMTPVLARVVGILAAVLWRAVFGFVLWLSAPPVLYIVLGWMLLRDCDFFLTLANNVPGIDDRESEYFRDKVCWVTGATSGIGYALAIELSKRGAYVILSSRRKDDLDNAADDCQRSYLVSEIRTLPRTESSVAAVVEEVSDVVRSKVLVVPLDIGCPEMFGAAVRTAVAWRGRVDMFFNNAGVTQRSILAEGPVDADIFRIDLLGPAMLMKALVPLAMQPVPPVPTAGAPISPSRPQLKFPHLERMTTTEFKTAHRSLGLLVRQVSLDRLHSSARLVRDSHIGSIMRRIVWGPRPQYQRTFHMINTSSILARIPRPGRAAYGAAKEALTYYADVTKMEMDGLARAGSHTTECVVTNCLIGPTHTAFLSRAVLTSGKVAGDEGHAAKPLAHDQMTPERCAQLMLRATYCKAQECWITKAPHLIHLYVQYYAPWIWRYISYRFLEFSELRKMLAYNEQQEAKLQAKMPAQAEQKEKLT